MKVVAVCDFDDTATYQNVAHMLMNQFLGKSAFEYRKDFLNGLITFRVYQEMVFNLAPATLTDMGNYAAQHAKLREGFLSIVELVQKSDSNIKFAIASAGLDFYIKPVMKKAGCEDIPIASGECRDIIAKPIKRIYTYPFYDKSCKGDWVTCKCKIMRDISEDGKHTTVFIGDGSTSDLCAAQKADFVFATGKLFKIIKVHRPKTVFEFKTMFVVKEFVKTLSDRR